MNLLHNLFEYLRSDDPNKVAQALDILANSATIAKLVGIDRAARDMINRIFGSISSTPDPKGCNPECLKLIHLLEQRVLELEKSVFLPHLKAQANIAIKVLQNNIDAKDSSHIAKTAIIEARLSGGCVLEQSELIVKNRQRQAFLYLAGNNYASQINTLSIAIHRKFLWRSYFANTEDGHTQAIPNVMHINEGDIVVLAFLNGDSTFRVLVPLLVKPEVNGLLNITNTPATPVPAQSPFRQVDRTNIPLITVLTENVYRTDPRVGAFVGLPVCLINTDFDAPLATAVYGNSAWLSPGGLSIYPKDSKSPTTGNYLIPEPVRNWMRTLIEEN